MAVVLSVCGVCKQAKFVENAGAAAQRAETGEELICDACMEMLDQLESAEEAGALVAEGLFVAMAASLTR